jgi:uncharacterized membrane protein
MVKIKIKEKNEKANKTEKKINFFFLTRLFFAISIILVFWILIIAFGLFVGMGYNWALFDIELWLFFVIFVLIILVFIDVLFLFILARKKGEELTSFEEADDECIQGKKVLVFTNPKNAEGGIFSKTYITIDNETVLKLRELMTPPEELWD